MRTFSQIILEMSFDAAKAKEKVSGLMDPINDHLIKLCLMPNSSYRPHWESELKGWLGAIAKIDVKPKNRKLSKDTYFKILFIEPFEGISDYSKNLWIDPILEKYGKVEISLESIKDIDVIIEKLRNFHDEISELISSSRYSGKELPNLLKKHLNI